MVLHKMFARLSMAMIAGACVYSTQAVSDVVADHDIAVTAVAATQACAKQHPNAGISLEKFILLQKADITPDLEKTINEVATNPMYASEVKQSLDFFSTPDGMRLSESICAGMIAAK